MISHLISPAFQVHFLTTYKYNYKYQYYKILVFFRRISTWVVIFMVLLLIYFIHIFGEQLFCKQIQKVETTVTGKYYVDANSVAKSHNLKEKFEYEDKTETYSGINKPTASWEGRCHSTRRPTNIKYTVYGSWQITKRSKDKIIAYSAFYDDRDAIGTVPVIQVIAVSTTKKDIFCQIWYEGKESPFVSKAEITASGRPHHYFGETYGQYYFTCRLPSIKPIPTHITLAGSECGRSTILLPVVHSPKSNWTVEFGICVSVSHSNIPINLFIEWMEMSLRLGVGEVHLYNGTASGSIKNVWDSYVKEGKLTVMDIHPAVESWTPYGAGLGSPGSLNDCMLRNMYHHRYIIVLDFDEVIVPRKSKNYHDMLIEINKEHKITEDLPVYSFHNTLFLKDFPPDETQPENVTFLRYQNRGKPGIHGAGKSIVDPRKCLSVFNHYCYVRFPRIKYGSRYVKSSIAFTHHYKKCRPALSETQCELQYKHKTKDNIMMNFRENLLKNIERRKSLL